MSDLTQKICVSARFGLGDGRCAHGDVEFDEICRTTAYRHTLVAQGCSGYLPALVDGADHVGVWDEDVVEEDFVEGGVTGDVSQRSNLHAVGFEVDGKHRDAFML